MTATRVAVQRDWQHGTIELNYIYENLTSNPKISDCSHHNGAARVQAPDEDGKVSMEGVYFTDRNWNQGLNTAGYISFERAPTGSNEIAHNRNDSNVQ